MTAASTGSGRGVGHAGAPLGRSGDTEPRPGEPPGAGRSFAVEHHLTIKATCPVDGRCSEHGKTGITKACERCDTLFDAGLLGAFNGRFCGLCDMLAEFEAAGIPYRLGVPPIGVSRGS